MRFCTVVDAIEYEMSHMLLTMNCHVICFRVQSYQYHCTAVT